MGANDAAEMLAAAKVECVRLERANAALSAEVDALEQRIADIAEAGLFDAETWRHRVEALEAKLAAVRAWSIQWGRDTRRAMARDALTTILAVDAQADHE